MAMAYSAAPLADSLGGALKPAARLKLTILGGFQAQLEPGPALVLTTKKAQALLAYLALPPGQAHPRDKLATLLWGDMPDAQARGNLRHALSRIRKALPRAARPGMVLDGPSVALDPSVVDVDVARFERLVADGRPAALEQIAGLYRGDLLAGLALDPLQEPVHRAVMRLYARLGRREAALRQYHLCVDTLKREFNTPPEAETTQLYQEILRSRPIHPDRASVSRPVGGDPAPAPIADLLSAAAAAPPEA